jgi:hypothetical protein
MRESWAGLLKSFGGVRWFGRLRRLRRLQLGQGVFHALLEITRVTVLKSAIVGLNLHLTLWPVRYQGNVVLSLEDRSGNGDMSGVLHIVGSSHVGAVTLHDGVVLRIAKGVLDRAPRLASRN